MRVREAEGTEVPANAAPGILTIDTGAIRLNYRKLKALAAMEVGAVVKADAYGLGAETVVDALVAEGCTHFFVAHLFEALRLRSAKSHSIRLFVLNGLQPGGEAICAQEGIVPVLNSLDQLTRWSAVAEDLDRPLPAVLQFDTGMSRLGIPVADAARAASLLERARIELLFVMSHLSSADEAGNVQNSEQLRAMEAVSEALPGRPVCFANSGGILLGAAYHKQIVRSGIALYGGAPNSDATSAMHPVVCLDVAVVQTRTVRAGTRIGYGGTLVAEQDMHLATIAAGYADGLPRTLSGRGAVYFNGKRLPMVGRISMDSIIVDITEIGEAGLRPSDMVEVIGPRQTLDALATAAGTISYEILTGLGDRFHRRYR